jgi:hypothetical protein
MVFIILNLLERPERRWEYNIRMDLQEMGWGGGWRGMDWIDLAQGRDSGRAFVKAVMYLRIQKNAGNFLTK